MTLFKLRHLMKHMSTDSDILPINSFPDSFKGNHSSFQSRVLHRSSRSVYHPVNLLSRDWKDRGETNGQTGPSWRGTLSPRLPASLRAMQAMKWLVPLAVHEDDVYPQILYFHRSSSEAERIRLPQRGPDVIWGCFVLFTFFWKVGD